MQDMGGTGWAGRRRDARRRVGAVASAAALVGTVVTGGATRASATVASATGATGAGAIAGLPVGGVLAPGQSIASGNGQYLLSMLPSGDLVETSGAATLWSTSTSSPGASATLAADGQLELLTSTGAVVWSSPVPSGATGGTPAPMLSVADAGPVTIAAGATVLWTSGPVDSTLRPGQELRAGQSVATPDGQYVLTMRRGGALALTSGAALLWSSRTRVPGSWAVLQGDGNLVVYSPAGRALWSSGTGGHPGLVLALTGSGQAMLQAPTGGHAWAEPGPDSTLAAGQELRPGWYIRSANGLFQLSMSAAGRLVEALVQPGEVAGVWYMRGPAVAGSTAVMQADGNLVVRAPSGRPVWTSGTAGRPGATLAVTAAADLLLRRGGATLWDSRSATLGTTIVADAVGQLGNADRPAGTFCNPYTAYWGSGAHCADANRAEAWCADFAAWVWRRAGVPFTYAWLRGDLNGGAASFYQWGAAHGTWHPARSGYRPHPGDVAVFGLDRSGTYADHAAIVVTAGDPGADVVNGDWWSTGNGSVVLQDDEATATGKDRLSGYASPLVPRRVDTALATVPLVASARLAGGADRVAAGRLPVAPAGGPNRAQAALLARQAEADRASEGL